MNMIYQLLNKTHYILLGSLLICLSNIVHAQTMYVTEKNPLTISQTTSGDSFAIPIKCQNIVPGTLEQHKIFSIDPDNPFIPLADNRRHNLWFLTPGRKFRELLFDVYLPPGHSLNNQYPIVIMLDGGPSLGSQWQSPNGVNVLPEIDKALACGLIEPSIFIFPQSDGGKLRLNRTTFIDYTPMFVNADPNHSHPNFKWRDYYEKELLKYAEENFNADLGSKYIVGYSTGSAGALKISTTTPSTRYPDNPTTYKGVGLLSPCVQTRNYLENYLPAFWNGQPLVNNFAWFIRFAWHYGFGLVGPARIAGSILSDEPITNLRNKSVDEVTSTKWYVGLGNIDDVIAVKFTEPNERPIPPFCSGLEVASDMLSILYAKFPAVDRQDNIKVSVEYGTHSTEFWRNQTVDLLAFLFGRKVCLESDATCTTGTVK